MTHDMIQIDGQFDAEAAKLGNGKGMAAEVNTALSNSFFFFSRHRTEGTKKLDQYAMTGALSAGVIANEST